jgi:Na+/H+-dicarboxylate symporter
MSLFPAALTPSSPHRLAARLDYLLRGRLWAQILLAMVLGVALGLCLSPSGGAMVSSDTAGLLAAWLALPGRLFLAMIQMVVVPLVLSSIILGITSSGDPKFLKQIGLRIAPYFILTTSVAVLIGSIVALWLQPGQYIDVGSGLAPAAVSESAVAVASLPDRLIEIIPANPTSALLSRSMFQIVVLAIFIAVAMVSISERRAKPLLDLCVSVQDVSMKIVSWAMALAPIAVFGLLAQISVQVGFDAIIGVATYVATVLLGLVILLGFYLLIVTVLARRSPVAFLRSISNVQLLAFSTSSSAAVMPLSMKTAEESLGVKPAVSQFVVPLGATVNMDGTALYQVIAAVFLTQVYGIELSIAQLLLLSVTTVGASIGSPSTPGVGIVILATIVQGMGVPAEGLALIMGVDRILDMSRTAVNVSGDLTACVVMERFLDDKVSD